MAKSKRKGRKVHTGIKKRNEREREGSIERERETERKGERVRCKGRTIAD